MTPGQLAKSDSEAAHQTALFAWAALQVKRWPELRWLHHIPNGGSRGDDAKSRAIRGGQLKAQGVRTGVSDVSLPVKRGLVRRFAVILRQLVGHHKTAQITTPQKAKQAATTPISCQFGLIF